MPPNTWQSRICRPLNLPPDAPRFLIETTTGRPQLHSLLIYAYIVAHAKKMRPVFLADGHSRRLLEEIAPRYLSDFEIRAPVKCGYLKKAFLAVASLMYWARVLLGGKFITLRWQGLQIGDIVYDQYLAACQHARMHRGDWHLPRFFYLVLHNIEDARYALTTTAAKALLLSHRVGLSGATYANAAQTLGLEIFSFGGAGFGTLIRSRERKTYEYTPKPEELAAIVALPEEQFEALFEHVQKELFGGAFNADAPLAFSRRRFHNRDEFAQAFGLPANKKNVFVMLHAFTDYPHSHFNGMLFKDFHEWFVSTLECAANVKNVNWIIKSHPAAKFYPTKDMDLRQLEERWASDHLVFMHDDADFDSRSICDVGDAVITCIGSAGFEFSALGGIPSITAGDNPYASAGFAIYPRTQIEYFDLLQNISSIGKLTNDARRRARATFMFIHRLSRVSVCAIPTLSHAEQRSLSSDDRYFAHVSQIIEGSEEYAAAELNSYIEKVAHDDFSALRTTPEHYIESIRND